MLRRVLAIAFVAAASLGVAACGFETGRSDVVAPSSSGSGGSSSTAPAVGVWNSLSFTPPDPKSCGNFEWKITNQTPTSMAGDFSASCMNGAVEITGSASGHINGTIVPISASGQATSAGLTCPFQLDRHGQYPRRELDAGRLLRHDLRRADVRQRGSQKEGSGTATATRTPAAAAARFAQPVPRRGWTADGVSRADGGEQYGGRVPVPHGVSL